MKTKEAFTKWFCEVWDSYPFTYEKLLKGEAVLNYEYAFKFDIQNKAWEAACEYKQKEIDELLAENDKLRECLEFYADRNSYNVNPFEILTKYSIARLIKFDDVEEIDEVNYGGKRARQVLKELGSE